MCDNLSLAWGGQPDTSAELCKSYKNCKTGPPAPREILRHGSRMRAPVLCNGRPGGTQSKSH
eukprot:239028-Pyramimonas_sp.AAC.1